MQYRSVFLPVILSSTLSAPAGTSLAAGDDQRFNDAKAKADEAKAQFERTRSASEGENQRRAISDGMTNGHASPEAKAAYDSAGYDVALLRPLTQAGWQPGFGFAIGLGARGSQVRCDLSLLRWSRQDDATSTSLAKRTIPIFFGWRGGIIGDFFWYQVGGELGYDSEQVVNAQNIRGDISSLFYGVGTGLGTTFSLGDFYWGLHALFHYNRRMWGGSDLASDADVSTFTNRSPAYFSFGLALGYQPD